MGGKSSNQVPISQWKKREALGGKKKVGMKKTKEKLNKKRTEISLEKRTECKGLSSLASRPNKEDKHMFKICGFWPTTKEGESGEKPPDKRDGTRDARKSKSTT